jgi:histidinol-phosphate phosphatase family protein
MKNKYIIFDRDGTLIKHVHYLTKIDDIEFLPGVVEGLAALATIGYKFGIITNQSLIGRKIANEAIVDKVNLHILDCLKLYNINIDFVYICPHIPSEECECRKPKIGLGVKALSNFAINTSISYMIGDAMSDIQFGINLGLKTVQINPLDHIHSEADFVTNNMIIAAEWILKND